MNRLLTSTLIASAVAGGALLAGTAGAADLENRIEVGTLECELLTDEGNIITSTQEYACTFDPLEESRATERYSATIGKVGLDLSTTTSEKLYWGVLAATDTLPEGVLAGEYGGVAADVALGLGAGAKVLVGGLDDSIALQPASVGTQKGFGASLSLENLTLTHIKP